LKQNGIGAACADIPGASTDNARTGLEEQAVRTGCCGVGKRSVMVTFTPVTKAD
jgi:hypothetical protein